MKVFINPTYSGKDKADGGIRRVTDAMVRGLPDYGWNIANTPDEADLIVNQGAALIERPGIPMVCVNHGLMWEDYNFGLWGDDVNKAAINTMIRAQAITAPSRWVARAIARGMLTRPIVIYHGVDAEEWEHREDPLGYVFWNKARVDPVSDPADMQAVAKLLPDIPFVTTFGEQTPNVLPIGPKVFEEMRSLIRRAGVYLATARETFGIGTLEALAAGVPIAGWDYGGQAEIVIPGETGYLAPFGDLPALAECIKKCLAERDRLSKNCREDARLRWGWADKIRQYAGLFDSVVEGWTTPRPKISAVITNYNLGQYLEDCIGSVVNQTMSDWECIVVDDDSRPDDIGKDVVELWRPHDPKGAKIQYLRTPKNLGLAGARNYGVDRANGKYILFLDADDMLEKNALDTLSAALDRDSSIHIAYGGLDTISHDGTNRQRNPWPAGAFTWQAQLAHLNQLPYAAMMRREVLSRSGGYRDRDWRAEDASFWSRVTSFGFRAERVTQDTTLIYRMHEGQKSRQEARSHPDRDGDWTSWLPWRIAGTATEGMAAMDGKRQPPVSIVPFGAQGTPPIPRKAWPVRHFQHPLVSIIIPVGLGHERFLVDVLDSVQAQTMVEWECIVVNDTGAPLDTTAHPWAEVWEVNGVEGDTALTRLGPGAARNWGLRHAKAPFVLFLDADDLIVPRALEALLKGAISHPNRYVYGDWLALQKDGHIDGPMEIGESLDYEREAMFHGMLHPVTTLIPTDAARAVGGFDESLPVFEDWDFYCKTAEAGYCGVRINIPLLVYRRQQNLRTRQAIEAKEVPDQPTRYTELGEKAAALIHTRYQGKDTTMGCGSCGDAVALGVANAEINSLLAAMTGGAIEGGVAQEAAALSVSAVVRMEYIGDQWGAQTWRSEDGQRQYRAGRDPRERTIDVDPRDVARLEGFGCFQRVNVAILQAAAAPDGHVPAVVVAATHSRVRGRRAAN